MWIGNHLDISFQIWNGRHLWFWFVADQRGSGAAIGAAPNQADAICEARLSIEEMAARRSASEAARISGAIIASHASPIDIGWHELLASLERYLTRYCSQCV
jgi:hypothetical protein